MGRGRSRARAAGLVCGALLLPVAAPSAALASANLRWGSAVEAGVPANHGTNPGAGVGSVSCASAGNCTAVGGYRDGSNHTLGLLLTESAGSWSNGVAEAPTPTNGSMMLGVGTNSVSCALAGGCGAVGYYDDNSDLEQGLLLTQSGGSWSNGATEATLPGPSATNPGVTLHSVSCPSAGNCSAVGTYADASFETQGLLLGESSGFWTPAEAQPPNNKNTSNPYVTFYSVSCPAPGSCGAVGTYEDTSMHSQGLLLNESGGSWSQGVEVALPANANLSAGSGVLSVSCPASGKCTAIGDYGDSFNHLQGLLVSESSGSWSTPGVEAPLPANANSPGNPDVLLSSVSCASAGNCTVVGSYRDTSAFAQGLLLTESQGSWVGVEAKLPTNANANPNVSLSWVSCVSAGNCAAVGTYRDTADSPQGLLLTEYHGSWSVGVEAPLPASPNSNPSVVLSSVSCPSAGNCTAVGGYTDSSGKNQGMMLSATPARPALTMSAPSGGVVGSHIAASAVTATLTGGSAPVGTIAFNVIGPRSTAPTACKSGGTLLGTARVSGNKPYHPSAPFTPHAAGDYWWYASYGGDASDTTAASRCGAGMPRTVVRP